MSPWQHIWHLSLLRLYRTGTDTQRTVSVQLCKQAHGSAGIWVFIMQHEAYCGCLSLRCLSKGLGGQKAYNWTMKLLNTIKKINSREDRFIQGAKRNWTEEVLKRSHNEVKCRIFLKGGVNALLYLDGVLSPKAPQSDQQMLILLKALSLRHPQTGQLPRLYSYDWVTCWVKSYCTHLWENRQTDFWQKAPLWLCGNCKLFRINSF